jgi:hypothetical protein
MVRSVPALPQEDTAVDDGAPRAEEDPMSAGSGAGRVELDGTQATSIMGTPREHWFTRSTILAAIDALLKEYNCGQAEALLADWDEEEIAFYEGTHEALHRLRTLFTAEPEAHDEG